MFRRAVFRWIEHVFAPADELDYRQREIRKSQRVGFATCDEKGFKRLRFRLGW